MIILVIVVIQLVHLIISGVYSIFAYKLVSLDKDVPFGKSFCKIHNFIVVHVATILAFDQYLKT